MGLRLADTMAAMRKNQDTACCQHGRREPPLSSVTKEPLCKAWPRGQKAIDGQIGQQKWPVAIELVPLLRYTRHPISLPEVLMGATARSLGALAARLSEPQINQRITDVFDV